MKQPKRIRYYAVAVNPETGRIGQLIVTKVMGKPFDILQDQTWTGKTYRTNAEAQTDLIKLNVRDNMARILTDVANNDIAAIRRGFGL
jgi:hypothetical protein